MYQKITDRNEQLDLLQRLHWSDYSQMVKFTMETWPDGRYKVYLTKLRSDKVIESSLGFYNDVLSFTIESDELLLREMQVNKTKNYKGQAMFSSRINASKNIIFDCIGNIPDLD